MAQDQLMTDADVFGAAPTTVQPAAPVSVQALPNLPGYVSDPSYTPPAGRANNPAWQAPAVALGGPGDLSDADVFGQTTPAAAAANNRPASQSLGFMESLAKPFRNFSDFNDATLGSLPAVGGMFHSNATDQAARAGMGRYFAQREQTERPGAVGQFAGNVIGTAPFVMGLGPVAGGAVSGALDSDAKTPTGVATDAALSALGGKFADMGLNALKSVISPTIRPAVQWALDHGIRLPPSTIMGGPAQAAEKTLSRLTLAGPMVRNSQIRTIEDFGRATIDNALQPAGLSLPKDIPAGHEAVNYAHTELSKAYTGLLPNLTVQRDPQLASELANLRTQTADLDGPFQSRMNKILDRVESGFDPSTGAMPGTVMKDLDVHLGKQTAKASTDGSLFANEYGDLSSALQGSLRDAVERSNPAYADQLTGLNTGWAQLVRIERAALAAKQRGGVFTPNDLITAVGATDQSARDSATSRGQGLLQDWANQAKQVVPNTMPTGGHWLDHLMEAGVALGVGKEAGMPLVAKGAALEALLGSLYSKPLQPAVTAALTKRPGFSVPLANAYEPLRPAIQAAGATQFGQIPYVRDAVNTYLPNR